MVYFNHHTAQRGFTLIEILVVFAIMGVLSAVGFASYATFNGAQSVQTGASDVSNLLNTAKIRAISQIIPTQCSGKTLTGYQVQVTIASGQYLLNAVCSGSTYLIQTRTLPVNVTFATGSTTAVTFAVASGTPSTLSSMIISGNGKTKTVSVTSTGTIMIN